MATDSFRLSDFDYQLPPELIAQHPAEPRDSSRLMVIRRDTAEIEHRRFHEIIEFLKPQDLLVLNNTKVVPARLLGRKRGSPGEAEIFLLRQTEGDLWSCLVRPGRRLRPGSVVEFEEGLAAEIREYQEKGRRLVEFTRDGKPLSREDLIPILEKVGHVPLPPYISRPDGEKDRDRYQTVYARQAGAVAAPTAGLHFTPHLLESIKRRKTEIREIMLHVGWGTFKPVETEDIRRHRMDEEYYRIDQDTAGELSSARSSGKRIVAVGTTTVRALESFFKTGKNEDWTDIFIYPPYRFGLTDGLVTNFHLPRSTLLMLVSAFAGIDIIKRAYIEAIRERYRFYSYGDAMLII